MCQSDKEQVLTNTLRLVVVPLWLFKDALMQRRFNGLRICESSYGLFLGRHDSPYRVPTLCVKFDGFFVAIIDRSLMPHRAWLIHSCDVFLNSSHWQTAPFSLCVDKVVAAGSRSGFCELYPQILKNSKLFRLVFICRHQLKQQSSQVEIWVVNEQF